ncbi:MAG TPA: putative glycoside hydrolase, partial [Deltaproteobacteria bacterium]|nr:putative glycoside hydrolase [Deltaproteobacteria bacterium]
MRTRPTVTAAFILATLVTVVFSVQGVQAHEIPHTVRPGDTLASIAASYVELADAYTKKEFIEEIKRVNNLGDRGLSVGMTLAIPVVRSEPLRPSSVKKPRDFVAKGAYINQFTAGTRQVFTVARRLKACGGNTIVFDAKEVEGLPTYRSAVPREHLGLSSYAYTIEDIHKLVEYLHAMGMHVVARVCMFRDFYNSTNRAAWRFADEWVNPANPAVQEYNLAIVRELLDSGVDEIQVDYFRYPADGKTQTGLEGKSRSDVLCDFARRLRGLTQAKGVVLSLDMFGIVIWQKKEDILILGQDVVRFKDHFDVISPMLYPSHFVKNFSGVANPADEPYLFVNRGVKRMKALVGDAVVIRPWLQSFPLRVKIGYNAAYVRNQIHATCDAGGTGWLLWSPKNRYEEAFRA